MAYLIYCYNIIIIILYTDIAGKASKSKTTITVTCKTDVSFNQDCKNSCIYYNDLGIVIWNYGFDTSLSAASTQYLEFASIPLNYAPLAPVFSRGVGGVSDKNSFTCCLTSSGILKIYNTTSKYATIAPTYNCGILVWTI